MIRLETRWTRFFLFVFSALWWIVSQYVTGLKKLPAPERKVIGEDIKVVQFGWPLGMPLVRKMDKDLWEVRIHLENRIAHVLFTVDSGVMVLLHAFIKKSQGTPRNDLDLAKSRLKQVKEMS